VIDGHEHSAAGPDVSGPAADTVARAIAARAIVLTSGTS
jgi:hypothetical protein